MMRRTIELLVTLALGLLLVPGATEAQQTGKVARIGWLLPFRSGPRDGFNVFRQAMRELGWVEGQNLVIEFQFAELQYDRLPELAAELVRSQPEVIIAHTTPSALAAKRATPTIPIVMIFVDDAVSEGLVASLAHPGGNLTGLSMPYAEVSGKRLEFLREVVPNLAHIAVLYNPMYPSMVRSVHETQVAAQALGVTLQLVEVREPSDFDHAFAAMTSARAEALMVLIDPLVNDHRGRIADLAVRSQLPTMFDGRGQVEAGGLLAYGVYWPDVIRRAAYYVDRILKGAKPADVPVEQPAKFDLVVNQKTAKALGKRRTMALGACGGWPAWCGGRRPVSWAQDGCRGKRACAAVNRMGGASTPRAWSGQDVHGPSVRSPHKCWPGSPRGIVRYKL